MNKNLQIKHRQFRLWLLDILGVGVEISIRKKLFFVALIFFISFSVKSLQMTDLAPIMHTEEQLHLGMAGEYYRDALFLIEGRGILIPDNWDAKDTSLLVHAPGYGIVLGVIQKLFGGSYFTIQFLQNILNSFSAVLMFLIAGSLISWRVGMVAGFLCAVSHHFSYYSNVILPDALCALPILLAIYLLVKTRRGKVRPIWVYILAGILIGVSIWLRPNALLMGLLLAIFLIVVSVRRRQERKRAWVLAVVPVLVILPITLRNYVIFGEFSLISANTGIVLWEGIGDASGDRFGAVTDDVQVAQQEGVLYNNPEYAKHWAAPDGIKRDHDRVKRSLNVILHHPFWFMGAMVKRMGQMLKYSGGAPLIFKSSNTTLIERGEALQGIKPGHPMPSRKAREADRWLANTGNLFFWLRPIVIILQRVTKETAQVFILIGAAMILILSWRRFLWVMMVPLYYLLIQSTMHTEFRYTLPMHYFLFVFAAIFWIIISVGIYRTVQRLVSNRYLTLQKRDEHYLQCRAFEVP